MAAGIPSTPMVSVGMPVFNGERTIRVALSSVLAQTYENLEVLVYNNGSTDGTEAEILDYARSDPRIVYRAGKKNLGASFSFSETFRMSSGSYFMWLAADDEIESAFVEYGVDLLESDPEIGVSVPFVTAYLEGQDDPVYEVQIQGFEPEVPGLLRLVRSIRQLPAICLYGLFRTEILQASQLLTSMPMADVVFLQEVALRGAIVTNERQRMNYYMAPRWKSTTEEFHLFTGDEEARSPAFPALRLLRDRLCRMRATVDVRWRKSVYSAIMIGHELWRLGWRFLWRLARTLMGRARLRRLGLAYYGWRADPSFVTVLDRGTYERRVILPTLGLD